ncbi:hypothetical protein G9F72_026055 [Clostridium estertheticum]|uniref:hypothetical protein n=1 Tax=Clostridium estertheticum TaxID=238834 RepID=UPI0013E940D3|nr:hypothetical protein [Clostridium estertheticum]MBZ9689741.1 hypothetical protein [Clostridium estertheticum]
MRKKVFIIIFSFIFIAISIFQYSLNYKKRIKPPSSTWSKEVLISSGNITTAPNILKFNGNFLVAHNDNNTIKLLCLDTLGIKKSTKTFSAKTNLPTSIEIFTDDVFIYLSWFKSNGSAKSLNTLKLDKNLNLIEEYEDKLASERIKLDDHVMAVAYEDTIRIMDLKSKKNTIIKTCYNPSYIAGTKHNDKYIISYMQATQGVNYFYVKDGLASDIKLAGTIVEWSRVRYTSSALSTNGEKAYILLEYVYSSTFIGQKLLTFSLNKEEYTVTDYTEIVNENPFYNATSFKSNTAAKFLISGGRSYEKKELYTDILEITVNGKLVSNIIPLSRSKNTSMYPAVYNDTVIFCDFINSSKLNVYMVSSREDFKKAYNFNRKSEAIRALNDTFESFMFSIVYILAFGSLWIVPSLCIASIASLVEYKLTDKKRKLLFVFIYFLITLIKCYFIYNISFKKYTFFLPEFMTIPLGFAITLMISIPCCIYAYKKYAQNLQDNVVALSISLPLIIDSLLTLYIFVPFIK